jgi:hypothetical protein
MNILFVTSFKDIGRNNWSVHKRTNEEYINYFLILAQNIEYNLIVYLDEIIKNELLQKYTFNDNIIFIDSNNVDTFYNKYLNEERRVISDVRFQSKIPRERFRNNPETWSAKYTLINHSKINYVKHAKDIYPDYSFYSWIDFGFVKNINNIPKNLSLENFPDRIMYQSFQNISENRLNAIQMLKINDVKIAGSPFVIPKSLIDRFETLYENKINQWHENYICDDDQGLVLQLYYENRHLFHLIIDENWFSLYKHLCTIKQQPFLDGSDAVRYVLRNKIKGAFVECGVEYGRMEKIWIDELRMNSEERDIYLYDTFSGMTVPSAKDYLSDDYLCDSMRNQFNHRGSVMNYWNVHKISNTLNEWCYCPLQNVKNNIEGSGYNDSLLHYVVGDVCVTLTNNDNIPNEISILRLDTDWYESSKFELIKLYDKVSDGGIIIFDDYYLWNGQQKATDEYFNEIDKYYNFYKIDSKTAAIIKRNVQFPPHYE